jgi:hypothetical protein
MVYLSKNQLIHFLQLTHLEDLYLEFLQIQTFDRIFGNHDFLETQFLCFSNPVFNARDGPDFSTQSNFPGKGNMLGNWRILITRNQGSTNRQIQTRIIDSKPPATFKNTSCCPSFIPPRFSKTAKSIFSRLASCPVLLRCGVP